MRGVNFRFLERIALVAVAAAVVACGPSSSPIDSGSDEKPDMNVPDVIVDNVVPDATDDTRDVVGVDVTDVADADSGMIDADVAADVDATDANDVLDVRDVDVIVDVPDVMPDSDDLDATLDADDGQEQCEDDGLDCTVEVRGDDGACASSLQAGWCVIDGACVEDATVNPSNPCLECHADVLVSDWTIVDQKECDDGFKCTLTDVCGFDGVCSGVPVVCADDDNSCTDEACSADTGLCVTTTRSNGQLCDDDGNQCTFDKCQSGVCAHAVRNGSACSDGDLCTTGDACNVLAECKGNPKICADDGNVCTENGCDPTTGNCKTVALDDNRECEDYNWCTLNDGCRGGVCTGDPQDCGDDDPCTLDGCVDGPMGYCTNDPIFGSCEDGNLCTRGETCNTDGVCQGGSAIICDDFNACTDDSCDEAVGCVFSPNYNYCNDGNPCTDGDSCDELGHCVGIPKDCGDSNECTRDYCFLGNCHHDNETNGIDCDDGDVCTVGGKCDFGDCVPSGTVDCDDGNPCTIDLCDPMGGCYTQVAVCDDHNDCTTDSCSTSTGCVYTPNSNACNDGDACTELDKCGAGVCQGTPLDCADGDPCTLDRCTAGVCSNPPNTGDCDDGNACTTGEKCFNGICTNGVAVDCYDGSDCTTDSCNTTTGCVNTPISGGCDDGTVCTLNDKCSGGLCVGDVVNCDDGNFCTNDLCHPLNGCYTENNAFLCDDGNPCTRVDALDPNTKVDQCSGGSCQGTLIFRTPLMKAGTYSIGIDGNAGNGLDVDGNPGTCLPAGKCGNGIDNAFANMILMIEQEFNPDLVAKTASGDLAMFLEPELPGPVGSPFEMKMFFGHRTAPTSCNPATSGCNYLAFKADTFGACSVRYALGNATTASSHISAGGKDYEAVVYFIIANASGGSFPMPVPLKWARVEADVTVSGNSVTGGTGILGGVINKMDFKYAILSVPEDYFSPYTRAQVIQNVDTNLPMDADVDDNGVNESSSIGIKFSIVQGNVVGRDN